MANATQTERTRRYRARLAADAQRVPALEGRIKELEAAVKAGRASAGDSRSAERIAALEAKIAELETALARERAAEAAQIDAEFESALKRHDVREAIETVMETLSFTAHTGFEPSDVFKNAFLAFWKEHGDAVRLSHPHLLSELHKLLPAYRGGQMRLYRGDTFRNYKRRVHGVSWSASREEATDFAIEHATWFKDGGVLLETVAPADAIVCALCEFDDEFNEAEYVVNPLRLQDVRMVRRFSYHAASDARARRNKDERDEGVRPLASYYEPP